MNILESIGNTPLEQLKRIPPENAGRILVKLEMVNPTGSMKDRITRALAGGPKEMESLLSMIDHLVYATPDVDSTIEVLEKLLGVRAAPGGQHPGWGTRNALLSLGPRAYLEIMGPDRSQPEPAQPRPLGIDTLSAPRLVTWVARAEDVQAVIDNARRHTVDLGELQARSRKKPDGSILTWTMTDPTRDRRGGIVPYFINWGDSPHPAGGSPKGCRLLSLEAFHPKARDVADNLKSLGIDLAVSFDPIGLKAAIDCPKGRVILE